MVKYLAVRLRGLAGAPVSLASRDDSLGLRVSFALAL